MSTASTDTVSPIVEPPRPIHAGLEIGTSKICVAVAEARDDGSLQLLAIGESASRGVRKGEIVDSTEAAECIRHTLDDVEKKVGFSIDRVTVSFSGDLRRLHRTLDCLQSLQLKVDSVVSGAVASAHVIPHDGIDRPTLLIDLGGGVSDYCIMDQRGIWCEGVLLVGGDHLTCDLSIGLKIPVADAEALKISEGSAHLGNDDSETQPNRSLMRRIINLRVREIFEQTRDRIAEHTSGDCVYTQVMLTGGTSQLPGISNVAEEVFLVPIKNLDITKITEDSKKLGSPAYTTAAGLTIIHQQRTRRLKRSTEDLDIPTFLRK